MNAQVRVINNMVYLIHFPTPIGSSTHSAQHYIGWCKDDLFDARMDCHRKGRGSCLLRAANNAGIKWSVVRKWEGKDGNFERKLKNWKKTKQLCPVCNKALAKRLKGEAEAGVTETGEEVA